MSARLLTESAEPVDALADEFLERCRAGERLSIEEFANLYPAFADRIRDLFPALEALEVAGSEPEQLGDYRIIRRVGRGGMGVVYEAVQEPLGRRVALKVLSVGPHTKPTQVERFQREARTAAKLHHGNIVPVFGVGADHGAHFYAMQYIAGSPLDQVITEVRRMRAGEVTTVTNNTSSSWLTVVGGDYYRRAAGLAAQAADALAYAHQQGVLHRDIKPSNLLLDAQGILWVADFGLAKEAGADDLTTTGDVVGTLRYLAPERLTGTADARSDVYSLGATLYELLTLRPPFDAADRPTLVKQVTDGDPVPLRRLNASIPQDLETIVLKALAREPACRYASAADFAEDLRNVVADRPVKARRLSTAARAMRWARRNPATAALVGLSIGLILMFAVGATISAAVFAKQNSELAAAIVREGQRSDLALDAIGMFHGQLSQEFFYKDKRFERLRTQLLSSATKFYNDLESQLSGQNDTASRFKLARAHDQLAALVFRIRAPDEALSFYQKSVTMWENLAALPEADLLVHLNFARQLVGLGEIQMTMKNQTAADTFAKGRRALEYAEQKFGVSNDSQLVRVLVHDRTGYCLWHLQARVPEARVEFNQAAQILDCLATARPDDMSLQNWQGSLYMNIGITAAGPIQKERHLNQALAHYEKCLAADRSNPTAQYDVAHAHAALAKIVDVQIPTSVGLAHANEAIKITSALHTEYAMVRDFGRVQAMAHGYAAELYALEGRFADARKAAELARTGWQELSLQNQATSSGSAALAEALTIIADLDYAENHFEDALAGYQDARTIFESILAKTPTEWNYCNMAITIRQLGLAELALGHPAEAAVATRCARDLIEQRIRKLSTGASYWFHLACCHATLAGLAGVDGSGVPAADALTESNLAMKALRDGLALFRPPPARLAREHGLDPIRQRDDFQALVREMEALAQSTKH